MLFAIYFVIGEEISLLNKLHNLFSPVRNGTFVSSFSAVTDRQLTWNYHKPLLDDEKRPPGWAATI